MQHTTYMSSIARAKCTARLEPDHRAMAARMAAPRVRRWLRTHRTDMYASTHSSHIQRTICSSTGGRACSPLDFSHVRRLQRMYGVVNASRNILEAPGRGRCTHVYTIHHTMRPIPFFRKVHYAPVSPWPTHHLKDLPVSTSILQHSFREHIEFVASHAAAGGRQCGGPSGVAQSSDWEPCSPQV